MAENTTVNPYLGITTFDALKDALIIEMTPNTNENRHILEDLAEQRRRIILVCLRKFTPEYAEYMGHGMSMKETDSRQFYVDYKRDMTDLVSHKLDYIACYLDVTWYWFQWLDMVVTRIDCPFANPIRPSKIFSTNIFDPARTLNVLKNNIYLVTGSNDMSKHQREHVCFSREGWARAIARHEAEKQALEARIQNLEWTLRRSGRKENMSMSYVVGKLARRHSDRPTQHKSFDLSRLSPVRSTTGSDDESLDIKPEPRIRKYRGYGQRLKGAANQG